MVGVQDSELQPWRFIKKQSGPFGTALLKNFAYCETEISITIYDYEKGTNAIPRLTLYASGPLFSSKSGVSP